MRDTAAFLALTLVSALCLGCRAIGATPMGNFPMGKGTVSRHLGESVKEMRTVGVVVAKAQFLDTYADGSRSVNVEKTDILLSRFGVAVMESLKKRNFDAVLLAPDDEILGLIAEYYSLHSDLQRVIRQERPIESVSPMVSARQAAAARGIEAIAFVGIKMDSAAPDPRTPDITHFWRIFTNPSKATQGADASIVILSANGEIMYYRWFSLAEPIKLTGDESRSWLWLDLSDICEFLAEDLPSRSR